MCESRRPDQGDCVRCGGPESFYTRSSHQEVPVESETEARAETQLIFILPELLGSLKLDNVWVFVQLIFGPLWPMNQLNGNSNIA